MGAVAALEPVAAVLVPLRSSLNAVRFAVERWADEQSIEGDPVRSSLIRALSRVAATPHATPAMFLTAEEVRVRVQALEDRRPDSRRHTAGVVGFPLACFAISLLALITWVW